MARYSKTALYMVKRKETYIDIGGLYLVERLGSMARWGKREEAMRQLKSWWDENLNIDTKLLRFERVK